MSGGGGYGPSSTSGSSTPCEDLIYETILRSPKPQVISKLKPKDILEINKLDIEGPVVGEHPKHGIAGSILERLDNLLKCLDKGNTYQGEVLSINGSEVIIRISPE